MTAKNIKTATPERDRFEKLAPIRMQAALKYLRLIGNLSNKNNYEYSDTEANKIMNDLKLAFEDLRAKFAQQKNKTKNKWEL
tara:strand:+ start:256 stop:501 length:246 start_codon:yes stop_codon:yes gene_type:complete